MDIKVGLKRGAVVVGVIVLWAHRGMDSPSVLSRRLSLTFGTYVATRRRRKKYFYNIYMVRFGHFISFNVTCI